MKKLVSSLVVAFILIMTLAEGCARSAAGAPASLTASMTYPVSSLDDLQELERFLDSLITERMERYDIPSEVIAVVRDGQVVFTKGYGYADLDKRVPVDPERTIFRIGSVSKLFVWTAVMQLVEQGKLDLSADVNTYLTRATEHPGIRIPDTYPEPITLAHLLTHTSGFEKQDWYSIFPSKDGWIPLEEYLATHMPERVYPPGQFWVYSNYGTSLAAYIVERVSGMPFEEYVERFIYEPLEMNHSTFRQPLPPALSDDLATGLIWQSGKRHGLPSGFEWGYPAGSMSSTAIDMSRFMIAHLQNGRYEDGEGSSHQILGEQAAIDMHSQHFVYDPRLLGFTFGFFEEQLGGTRIIYHAGGSAAFSAHVALIPEYNLGVFEAYSGGEPGSGFIYTEVLRYYSRIPATPSASPGLLAPTRQYAGEYLDLNVNHSSPERLLALLKGVSVKENGNGKLAFLEGMWVQVEPLVFQEVGSGDLAVFRTEDGTAEGRVTYLIHGELAYEKLPWYWQTAFQLGLLAGCLLVFLSSALGWPVASFIQRRRPWEPELLPRLAHWTGWGMSVTFVGFVMVFVTEVYENDVLLYGLTPAARAILLLPLLGAVLTVVTLMLSCAAWMGWGSPARHPYWNLRGRMHYTLVALAGVAVVWWLSYWNLHGFR